VPALEKRLLVEHSGELRKLAKLAVSKSDASLYVVAYGPNRRYYVGQERLPAGKSSLTFRFADYPCHVGDEPKLSLHEKGKAHVTAGGRVLAGPIAMPRLTDLRGEHVATVCPDDFDQLPPYGRALKTSGREQDVVIPVEQGVTSGRVILYANAREPRFHGAGVTVFSVPALGGGVLYFGARYQAQPLFSESLGVTLLGGADPLAARADADLEFLVVRGV
jgi:hypothetical protein